MCKTIKEKNSSIWKEQGKVYGKIWREEIEMGNDVALL